ncbi:MAG: SOS response-associated peptidase [Hyphomicrobiales bacterium]
MCGRFTLTTELATAASVFGCECEDKAPPRYNIAPTQPISVIFQEFGQRQMRLMRWGFVPSWVKDPKDFSLIINARSESVLHKPSFKSAIRHRRCIIPADGFYEWHRKGGVKTPYYIKPKHDGVVGYAGIFETYASANGSEIDTACFLTTAASADIAAIHHRMPVLVSPEKAEMWLDCTNYSAKDVGAFYDNAQTGLYDIRPISDRVNSARFDEPSLQNAIDLKKKDEITKEENAPEKNEPSPQLSLF